MAEEIDQEALLRDIADLESRLHHAKNLLKSKDASHNEQKLYNQLTRNGTDISRWREISEMRNIGT